MGLHFPHTNICVRRREEDSMKRDKVSSKEVKPYPLSTRNARSIRRGILTYREQHSKLRQTRDVHYGLAEFSAASQRLKNSDPLAHWAFWEYRHRITDRWFRGYDYS